MSVEISIVEQLNERARKYPIIYTIERLRDLPEKVADACNQTLINSDTSGVEIRFYGDRYHIIGPSTPKDRSFKERFICSIDSEGEGSQDITWFRNDHVETEILKVGQRHFPNRIAPYNGPMLAMGESANQQFN